MLRPSGSGQPPPGSKLCVSPWQCGCRAPEALTQQDLLGPAPAREPRACRLGTGVMVAQLALAARTHEVKMKSFLIMSSTPRSPCCP